MMTTAETLAELFHERVQLSPEAPAYRVFDHARGDWAELSWRTMDERVANLRSALALEALARGERVALMLENGPDWIAIDLAAQGLGLVSVPLYVDDRPDNVAFILRETGARILLLQNGLQWSRLAPVLAEADAASLKRIITLQPLATDDPRVVDLATWCAQAAGLVPPTPTIAPDDLATIVYTSGTTGRPKGVMLSHRNILANARAAASLIDIGPRDRFLSFLPLSHMLERTVGCVLPMLCGAEVAFARSVQQLGEDLREVRPTFLISVPRIYERFARRIQTGLARKGWFARLLFRIAVDVGWQAFEHRQGRARWHPALLLQPLLHRVVGRPVLDRLGGRLRLAICGGAPLPPDIARLFLGLGLPLLQGYGLTEAAPVISVNRPDDNLPTSVGHPLPGVEVRLGEHDELQVRGPNVMLGYWHNTTATRALFTPDGWMRTGDQARIDATGRIFITGRLKDILVLASGEKVPPADMELALLGDPLFEQVMVVGEGRAHLVLLAVLNPEESEPLIRAVGVDPAAPASLEDRRVEKAVLARANRALYAFPGFAKLRRALLFDRPWTVEEGLLTPTLKLKRTAILARHAQRIDALYARHD
ncbi:MAG: long-chain fatty acid--CoA ligase [Halothiobacillaceae bacterium]